MLQASDYKKNLCSKFEPYFTLIEHVSKKQTMKNLQKIKQQISNKTSSILRKF